MRAHVVALALALLLGAPLVPAQGTHFITDAKGDALLVTHAGGASAPGVPMGSHAQSDAADLVWLDITETDDALALVVGVAALQGAFTGATYDVEFTWGSRPYRASIDYYTFQEQSFTRAVLHTLVEGAWTDVAPLALTVDAAQGSVSALVQKATLLDDEGRSPNKGSTLAGIRVLSQRAQDLRAEGQSVAVGFDDRMPDSGDGAAFTLAKGDEAAGHLRLSTTQRVRVSNGGATTMVYRVDVQNAGAAEDDVALAFEGVPADWTVTAQAPVRVPAQSNKTVAVLASIPFAHEHGGFDGFTVVATSPRDANARATVRLGVLHTPIPQPTGHHPELFLHGMRGNAEPFDQVFNYAAMWMSTDAAHEGDPAELPPDDCPGEGAHAWNIQLNPKLQTGLDFDVRAPAQLALALVPYTKSAGTIEAKLWLVPETKDRVEADGRVHFSEDGAVALAIAPPVAVALEPNQPLATTLLLAPTEAADYVPDAPGRNLWLAVTLRAQTPELVCSGVKSAPVLLTKDFQLKLPLEEYHDKLTGLAEAASSLEIVAQGAVEKTARPGTVMTYAFLVKNAGETDDDVVVELAGNDAKLGVLAPEGAFRLAAGESAPVTLGVRVPTDETEGTQIEVLLFAHARDDPSKSAIARTKTTVALGADALADESDALKAAQDAGRETPGAGLLVVVACALVAAVIGLPRRP